MTRCRIIYVALVTVLLSGCVTTTSRPDGTVVTDQKPPEPTLLAAPVASRADDPNEVAMARCYYQMSPWLSYDEQGDPNPEGLKFVLYLESSRTGKGVFADGQIRVEIFRIDAVDGQRTRTPVYDKSTDLNLLPRAKRESYLGWGYEHRLCWEKADVLGREIEVVVSYITPDGRPVRAVTKALRVPAKKSV